MTDPNIHHTDQDANKFSDHSGPPQPEAAIRQQRILRLGHGIAKVRDKASLLAVTEDICAIINAENLAVYVNEVKRPDYRMRFYSAANNQTGNSAAKAHCLPKKIDASRKLWNFFDKLTADKLRKVPGNFRIGSNVHAIAHRNQLGFNTVLVLSFTINTEPNFQLSVLHWLYKALEKSLLKVRQKQFVDVEHRGLKYLTLHTQESLARWDGFKGWQYFNEPLIYRLGYSSTEYPLDNIFGCQALIKKETWQRINQQFVDCQQHGEEQKCYYEINDPAGKIHHIQTTLNRVEQDDFRYINAVSVDISDIREAEQQAKREKELEQWLIAQTKLLHQQGDRSAIQAALAELNTRFQLCRSSVFIENDGQLKLQAAHVVINTSKLCPQEDLQKQLNKSDFANILVTIENPCPTANAANTFLQEISTTFGSSSQLIVPIAGQDIPGFLLCEFETMQPWNALIKRATQTLADNIAMVIAKANIQKRLEASRLQFQMALNAANYGLWELKIPEQLIKVSPNYYKMLGFEKPESIDFRPINVKNIHIDDKQVVLDQGQKLRNGLAKEVDYETRHHSHNGEIKWIQTHGRVIKWDDRGKPLRAMGTTSDITDLKKTQTDLQLAYQQAESARIAKGEFLARMSHEIRTPMNAIIGLTYMILQSSIDSKLMGYMQDIDRAAKSLLQIIDDILDFSKIEAGKLSIENHNFNLRRLIERICQKYNSTAAEKHLDFEFSFSDKVPHILQTDSTRIRQVLISLLNNAFKFTQQGKVSVYIDCEKLTKTERLLVISVSDTGIGLDAAQIATLFDPFTQADGSRSRQYGGTGLGLAIAKLLVTMMGGDIEVQSKKNKGSTFTFKVKYQPASRKLKASDPLADDQANTLSAAQFKQMRVLLVEDNKVNQKVAVGMLRQLGISTTIANNGTEAVYILKGCSDNEFDFILMDIEMPYMGGFEATRAIRSIPRHQQLPVIAMTAHMVEADKARYLNAGMDDCISKPITPAALTTLFCDNLNRPSTH